jgi:glycerophosphoryl diester phosphodiesterase
VSGTTRAPIGFAHRGGCADAPENTLAAFALALRRGATGLESDVWLTADGVPVLDHDGRVERAGERIEIRALPRSELPAHLPGLRDLYDACGTAFALSLDVKDEAAALPAVRAAREMGAAEQLWLCHWNWRVAASWRDAAPEVRLVDSTRIRHMRTPPEPRARRMVALGLDAINLHESEWTAERVEVFQRHGRRVLGWDAQEERALRRLVALGVDGLFCDHVERMVAVLRTSQAGGGACAAEAP